MRRFAWNNAPDTKQVSDFPEHRHADVEANSGMTKELRDVEKVPAPQPHRECAWDAPRRVQAGECDADSNPTVKI